MAEKPTGNLFEPEPLPGRCNARTRAGGRCKNFPTKANGKRCHMHGGAVGSGRPVITGRYSKVLRQSLRDKYSAFLEDPDWRKLRDELAIGRALLSEYLSRLLDGMPLAADDISRLIAWIDQLGRLAERDSRIEATTALTGAEVRLLEVTVVTLLAEYLDADQRAEFAERLADALGATVTVDVKPLPQPRAGQALQPGKEPNLSVLPRAR